MSIRTALAAMAIALLSFPAPSNAEVISYYEGPAIGVDQDVEIAEREAYENCLDEVVDAQVQCLMSFGIPWVIEQCRPPDPYTCHPIASWYSCSVDWKIACGFLVDTAGTDAGNLAGD